MKSISDKLQGFGPIYWVTLKTSLERQSLMQDQFNNLGISNHKAFYGFDCRETDAYSIPGFLDGPCIRSIPPGHICSVISHLQAIKEWYSSEDSEYLVVMEDDMYLGSVQYWNFTWQDIILRLPDDWEVVQLSLIRETPISQSFMRLRYRYNNNWSAGAYMLKRSYAKKLIDKFFTNTGFYFDVYSLGDHLLPLIENVLFEINEEWGAYTIPLFNENVSIPSSFYPNFIDTEHKFDSHVNSAKFIQEWWETLGKDKSVDELMAPTFLYLD